VNNPEIEEQDSLITLEVLPEMTLEALRSSIEAEGIPAPAQHLYHNSQLITDNTKTLQELQIHDGDMLDLHIRDMRGNTGVTQNQQEQQVRRRQAAGAQRGGSGSGGGATASASGRGGGAGALPQDPEMIRLQVLGDPRLRAEVERSNPPLAAALDHPQRFAQVFHESSNQQENARRARMRQIEDLNNDAFNPESQARIQEMIRQQAVMENLQNAMEYNPECK
jgi:DNA damage-inducible protein 1